MNNLRCTALILGSGPSGLFAADALLSAGHTDVVIVEHGKLMPKLMPKRICPPGPGCECRTCDVLEGEGGAGSFSDGKITLSATRGTHSQDLFTDKQALLLDVVWAAVRRNVSDAVDYAPVSQLSALAGHEKQLRGESYPLLPVGPVCFLNAHCRHATANRRGLAEQPQQSDGSRERHRYRADQHRLGTPYQQIQEALGRAHTVKDKIILGLFGRVVPHRNLFARLDRDYGTQATPTVQALAKAVHGHRTMPLRPMITNSATLVGQLR